MENNGTGNLQKKRKILLDNTIYMVYNEQAMTKYNTRYCVLQRVSKMHKSCVFADKTYIGAIKMKICGIQKLTLLDYPEKTACTIFTGGCNFRCPFCHNGDLVTGNEQEEISQEEILAFLKKRQGILDGVCITGGEPLLWKDIGEFIKKVKELGFLVKLDTNGSNPELLAELVGSGLIDYVAMDIKNSLEGYPETVGVSGFDTADIQKSVKFLMECGIEYEFRTTVVAEFHTEERIERLAEWISGAKRYFLQNFKETDGVIQKGLHSVGEEKLKGFAETAKKYIEKVELRGV